MQVRQRAEGQRRQEGRPRHHLPADDPRGGLRHAGLRPHRRRALGGVRRLLARQPRRPHRRLPTPSSSSPPTRACAAAGPSRSRRTPTRRCKKCKGDEKVLVVRRTGAAVAWTPAATSGCTRSWSKVDADCPPVEMSAEDPLFILYTSGSTGKPKGVLHTTGGYLVYASITHQYVFDYHDGDIYWCTADVGWVTGHSYILYGPLANGATTLMFEGVPNYPTRLALLARHRQVGRQHLLHGADGHPRADGRRRRLRQAHRSLFAQAAGLGRRADQSRGLGVVSPRGRRRPLPDRRHVVADGDRRHPDHAAAGRHQAQAGLGDAAVLRHQAGARRREGRNPGRRGVRQSRHPRQLARPDAHRLRRPRALRADLLLDLQGHVLHRRRLPPRRRRLLLDHGPRRRRDQRVGPPPRHGGGGDRRWSRTRRSRRPPWSAIRTTSRARASTATSR